MEPNTLRKRLSVELPSPAMFTNRSSIDIPYIILPLGSEEKENSTVEAAQVTSKELHPWDDEPDPNAPKDKFHFVRITIFILGFSGMLPMIMLQTANEYWMYKFRDVNKLWSHYTAANRTELQISFVTYHMVASIAPGVFFNLISAFIGHRVKLNVRARINFLMIVGVFVVNSAFTQIDTDSWQLGFFLLTMGSQALLSFSGVLGLAIIPITSKFPKKYLTSHLVGNGLTGIITAILRLISIVISPDVTSAALIYFATGTVVMLIATIMFELMKFSKYYQFYVISTEKADAEKEINSFRTVLETSKKVLPVIIIYTIGMLIPSGTIITLVVSEGQGSGSTWSDKYFVTTANYLIPALASILGRLWSTRHLHFMNGKFLSIATLVKLFIFVPLIFLSNAQPRHHLPILLKHDWEYMVMVFFHSFLEGYSLNLNMFWTTSLVTHDKIELGYRVIMMVMGALGALVSPLSLLAVKIL